MSLVVLEHYKRDEYGTHGVLYYPEGKFLSYTLEPTDSLPCGTFQLKLVKSPKFSNKEQYRNINNGLMIWVCREPEKEYWDAEHHQLLHIGNVKADTEDCILTGLGRTDLAITQSKEAYIKHVYPMLTNAMSLGDLFIEIKDSLLKLAGDIKI